MNIFFLSSSPKRAARYHNDKHVRKMIVETAQLLSTAHRLLDGEEYTVLSKNGRRLKRWKLPDERDEVLYLAAYYNHPCAVWVRKQSGNYKYAFELLFELINEFHYRFHKPHKSEELIPFLDHLPKNITKNDLISLPPMAMDRKYIISNDPVYNYRYYYKYGKAHLAQWTKRGIPFFLIHKKIRHLKHMNQTHKKPWINRIYETKNNYFN